MKKIILLLLAVAAFSGAYAQKIKHQEKKINYFVKAATEEFNLDEDASVKLLDARTDYVKSFLTINKSFKGGDISQDEKKSKMGKNNKNFISALKEITGKTRPELNPFLDRMRKELKNV